MIAVCINVCTTVCHTTVLRWLRSCTCLAPSNAKIESKSHITRVIEAGAVYQKRVHQQDVASTYN